MSAFNVNISSISSNVVLSKNIGKKRRQEESTTLVTNQHNNPSHITPSQTATTGAKHTKPEVGRMGRKRE
jgi:hypothetical protein